MEENKAPHIWIPGVDDIKEDLKQYANAKHERKPHGIIFANGQEVATTLQCPHCGGHFMSLKGSGHRRTFCMRCMAVTCGNFVCDPCKPFARELEDFQNRML